MTKYQWTKSKIIQVLIDKSGALHAPLGCFVFDFRCCVARPLGLTIIFVLSSSTTIILEDDGEGHISSFKRRADEVGTLPLSKVDVRFYLFVIL